MLKLERHLGQIIDITAPDGTLLTIKVCQIDRGQVQFGIDAPKNWLIDRREISIRKGRELLTLQQKKEVKGNV